MPSSFRLPAFGIGSFNRFLAVGVVNTIFGWGFFPVIYALFGTPGNVSVILGLSYVAGPTFSFATHKWVTFRSRAFKARSVLIYGLFYGLLYLGNLALLSGLATWSRVEIIGVQTIVAIATTVIQYLFLRRYVFPNRHPRDPTGSEESS